MAPLASLRRTTIAPGTYRRIVVVALVLLVAIVLTGAAVRLTESGLGCSDWPNCEPGSLIEMGSPNQAIEQVNRLFTGLVSVGVAAAVLGALKRRPYRRDLVMLSWGLVAGVLGQIVLGGITVLVDLHPVAVAGHFLLSMVLVVDATVLLWRAGSPPGERVALVPRSDVVASRIAMGFGIVVLAFTGPLITGAGPHAGDAEAPRFDVAIPDAARIHSISAWVFCAAVVFVLIRIQGTDAPAAVSRRGTVLLLVIVAQGAIGYLQYELGIPAGLVIAHIAGATAIAIAAAWFHLGLYSSGTDPSSGAEPNDDGGRHGLAPVGADSHTA